MTYFVSGGTSTLTQSTLSGLSCKLLVFRNTVQHCTVAERPVHCLENVAEILSRWSHWPDEFRQNNYLVMKPYLLVEDLFKTSVRVVLATFQW